MMEITISLENYDAVRRALRDPELVTGPLATMLKESAHIVRTTAVRIVPVDTGRLRSSIDFYAMPLRSVVYSDVFYAPFVEFGTRPHFPPPAVLQPWARRHGFKSAFPLARAIARRGTKPHPFMGRGAQELRTRLPELLRNLARDIELVFSQRAKGA